MTDYETITYLLAPAASLGFTIIVNFSHRRRYATWAKIASVVAFIAGAGWGILGFVLAQWKSYHFTHQVFYRLVGIQGVLCGVALAFTLCIAMVGSCPKADAAATRKV